MQSEWKERDWAAEGLAATVSTLAFTHYGMGSTGQFQGEDLIQKRIAAALEWRMTEKRQSRKTS